MIRGLSPTLIGLIPLTQSPTESCLLCLRDEEVGRLKTTIEPSSPLSPKILSSFIKRFRISGNSLKIW